MIRTIIILSVITTVLGMCIASIYNSIDDVPNYTVYINEDGSAEIVIDDIRFVNQLPDGTLVIDGGVT